MNGNKYYHDPSSDQLYIVALEEDEVKGITILNCIFEDTVIGEAEEEDEEEAEIEDVPEPPKKVRLCGKCGQPGHQARTCPQLGSSTDAEEPDPSLMEERTENEPGDYRSLTEKVRDLRADGNMLHEIYTLLPDHEMSEITAIYQDLQRKADQV